VRKDMREEELLFRGMQIADAVGKYQQKNGNAPPPSMEVLVKGKYLRKNYKDPFAKDGKWKFIKQGEPIGVPTIPGGIPQQGPGFPRSGPSPSPSASPTSEGSVGPNGEPLGGFVGVSSRSTEKSLRLFNGRDRYSEWQFLPSPHPRIIGRPPVVVRGAAPPGTGVTPNTLPGGGVNRTPQ
jgi:hypothetical protein